jgi:hypothetical protein
MRGMRRATRSICSISMARMKLLRHCLRGKRCSFVPFEETSLTGYARFTTSGIVALVFSCVAAIAGMALIGV